MGIQVELHVAGKWVQRLPDPSGGFFDAAGDFDRLVFYGDSALRLLDRLDPYGETRFGTSQMPQLVADVELLLILAKAALSIVG